MALGTRPTQFELERAPPPKSRRSHCAARIDSNALGEPCASAQGYDGDDDDSQCRGTNEDGSHTRSPAGCRSLTLERPRILMPRTPESASTDRSNTTDTPDITKVTASAGTTLLEAMLCEFMDSFYALQMAGRWELCDNHVNCPGKARQWGRVHAGDTHVSLVRFGNLAPIWAPTRWRRRSPDRHPRR